MSELGMDPQQVKAIAKRLDRSAEQIFRVLVTVTRLTQQTTSIWRGEDEARPAREQQSARSSAAPW